MSRRNVYSEEQLINFNKYEYVAISIDLVTKNKDIGKIPVINKITMCD